MEEEINEILDGQKVLLAITARVLAMEQLILESHDKAKYLEYFKTHTHLLDCTRQAMSAVLGARVGDSDTIPPPPA